MRAMVLRERSGTLVSEERDIPVPENGEVVVRVIACGVCRTDLHILEGDLPPLLHEIIPGHEIVGRVVSRNGRYVSEGQLVGVPWLGGTCGICEYCISGRENLCPNKQFTGYSRDGGYAEYAVAREDFLIPLPEDADPVLSAPLLCSGIIGYRSFKLCRPAIGGRIGIFGFGGSAHLTLQLATKLGHIVEVVSRGDMHLRLAEELGAERTWKSDVSAEAVKGRFDAAIVFAPAGDVVRSALSSLKKGGILTVPAVHLTDIPTMGYEDHLFGERKLMSVEANTRADAREFMDLAFRLRLRTVVERLTLKDANEALQRLKKGSINGAAVLSITSQ